MFFPTGRAANLIAELRAAPSDATLSPIVKLLKFHEQDPGTGEREARAMRDVAREALEIVGENKLLKQSAQSAIRAAKAAYAREGLTWED